MKKEFIGGTPGKCEVYKQLISGLACAVRYQFLCPDDLELDEERLTQLAQAEMLPWRTMATFSSPYILQPRYVKFFPVDGRIAVVMPLAACDWRQKFETAEELDLIALMKGMMDLAAGLEYLHSKNIAHGDIKTSNVLYFLDRSCLTDLGWRGDNAPPVMTIDYMPPEYFREGDHARLTPEGDQYSLAVMYAAIRQRRHPFPVSPLLPKEEQTKRLCYKIITNEPELALPDAEARVLRKAMARSPKDRYANCTEFVLALSEATGIVVTPRTPSAATAAAKSTMAAPEANFSDLEFTSVCEADKRRPRRQLVLSPIVAATATAALVTLLIVGTVIWAYWPPSVVKVAAVPGQPGPAGGGQKGKVGPPQKAPDLPVPGPLPAPGPVPNPGPPPKSVTPPDQGILPKGVPLVSVPVDPSPGVKTPVASTTETITPVVAPQGAVPESKEMPAASIVVNPPRKISVDSAPVRFAKKNLTFGGNAWSVKSGMKDGIVWNASEAVRLGKDGELRLSIEKSDKGWASSEIVGPPTFGYGDYEITLACPQGLDPQAVLNFSVGYFDLPDNRPQIGIDLSHWGDPRNGNNGQFVVGEWNGSFPQAISSFQAGSAQLLICRLRWHPNLVRGWCEDQAKGPTAGQMLGQWEYQPQEGTIPIPVPRSSPRPRPRLYLGLHQNEGLKTLQRQEVIMQSFSYTPWKGE